MGITKRLYKSKHKIADKKPLLLFLKFAALTVLLLLSVSVFGTNRTNEYKADANLSKLSAGNEMDIVIPDMEFG